VRIHQQQLARIERQANSLLKFADDQSDPVTALKLRETYDRAEAEYTEITDLIVKLQRLDPASDADYSQMQDQYEQIWIPLHEKIIQGLRTMGVPAAPVATAPPAPAPAAAATNDIANDLKPVGKLSLNMVPHEWKTWANQYKSYYSMSRMEAYDIPNQQNALFNHVEETLALCARERINVATPIFSDDGYSCMKA